MRSDRTRRRTRWKTAAVTSTLVLALTGGFTTAARAQVPATAELYGVHETTILHPHPQPMVNPFRQMSLGALYSKDGSGIIRLVYGFYDGDGAGGPAGQVWRIRFMPDMVGSWTMSWAFSDGNGSGSGTFTTTETNIPGPARQDPNNPQLLVDARGNPIHWRGYGIEHLGYLACCDSPLGLGDGTYLLQQAVDNLLLPKRYNATMVSVPAGWKGVGHPANGTCNPAGTQEDCPLWGNYFYYSMRASKVFDDIIKGLHQRRIWTIGWITFGLQTNWGDLSNPVNYEPLMRYFSARYGAYYNYFSWSPTWEIAEMGPQEGDLNWKSNLDQMMRYLQSYDPYQRLQGVHDQARTDWEGWQTILPRQQPSRSIVGPKGINGVNGNSRMGTPDNSAGWDSGFLYPSVIIGAEDIWEFCDGEYGKPRNRTEVRRGLVGGLFVNVLPVYNELFSDGVAVGDLSSWPCDPDGPGPLIGLGNGAGEGDVRWWLDWWYTYVGYRDPLFQKLNGVACGTDRQICSGIPGHQYVFYREGAGTLTVNLSSVPPSTAFDAWVLDVVNRAWTYVGIVNGGGAPINWSAPHAGDNAVFLRKVP